MSLLVWKHGKSKAEAIADVKAALEKKGYVKHVTWKGGHLRARYRRFFITLVDVIGEVTDEAIIIEKNDGQLHDTATRECKKMLSRLFPDGLPSGR